MSKKKKQIQVCTVKDFLPIDELCFHPENPRDISADRLEDLKKSIVEKGLYQPLLIWSKLWSGGKNIVLAGNHRLMAMLQLIDEGYTFSNGKRINEIPVVFEDVDEEQARAILLDSNNTYAKWVEDKLKQALKDAGTEKIRTYGFDRDFIDKLLEGALDGANEALEKSKKEINPVDHDKLLDAMGEEKQNILVVNKEVYENLLEIIAPIAKRLSKKWQVGDDISDAMQVMIDNYHIFCS